MGNKLEKETLTYEKLQNIIDTQLAHIEELETDNEGRENVNQVPPTNSYSKKEGSLWEKFKGIVSTIL